MLGLGTETPLQSRPESQMAITGYPWREEKKEFWFGLWIPKRDIPLLLQTQVTHLQDNAAGCPFI